MRRAPSRWSRPPTEAGKIRGRSGLETQRAMQQRSVARRIDQNQSGWSRGIADATPGRRPRRPIAAVRATDRQSGPVPPRSSARTGTPSFPSATDVLAPFSQTSTPPAASYKSLPARFWRKVRSTGHRPSTCSSFCSKAPAASTPLRSPGLGTLFSRARISRIPAVTSRAGRRAQRRRR